MKITPLMVIALASAGAFAQQPAAASVAPPAPAAPSSAAVAAGIPLTPRDTNALTRLQLAVEREKNLFLQQQNLQQALAQLAQQQQSQDQVAQQEILALKKQEGWGEDVLFNPQTEGFERVRAAGAPKPVAPTAKPASPAPAKEPRP